MYVHFYHQLYTKSSCQYLIETHLQQYTIMPFSTLRNKFGQFIKIVITVILIIPSQQFPYSFTIAWNISPSSSYQQFLSAISQPVYDSNLNIQTGYNLVALAGFTQRSTFASINNDLSPLYLWKNIYEVILGSKPRAIGITSNAVQNHILNNIFHKNGSKILMHVQLQSPISGTNPVSANSIGQQIVTTLNQLQLDGVSIAFTDHNAVGDNTASDWLQALLRYIKSNINNNNIMTILIVSPTIINKMRLFRMPDINSLVQLYVLKYYNTLKPDYTTYSSLFQSSSYYTQTSMFQLFKKDGNYIDICRTIIAKPVDQMSTWNNIQYMAASDISSAFIQAYNKIGWFAGYANLNYQTDKSGIFVNQVLNAIRDQCVRNQNCYC